MLLTRYCYMHLLEHGHTKLDWLRICERHLLARFSEDQYKDDVSMELYSNSYCWLRLLVLLLHLFYSVSFVQHVRVRMVLSMFAKSFFHFTCGKCTL